MARIVKKPEDRRREIVETARRLFETKGFEHASMQDVMESLGIAKGTIYHYFKSKQELLEAVIEQMVDESLADMQEVVDAPQGDAIFKLRELANRGNVAADEPDIVEHLHKPGNEAMHVRLLAAALVKQAPLYAQVIEQGCAERLFRTDYPLECAELILAGCQFLTDVGIRPWTHEELARRTQALPKLIEQQLNAPAGSFDFLIR